MLERDLDGLLLLRTVIAVVPPLAMCGEPGHNSRTCSTPQKHLANSTALYIQAFLRSHLRLAKKQSLYISSLICVYKS